MKQRRTKIGNWLLSAMFLLVGAACTDNLDIAPSQGNVREGIPVEIELNLEAATSGEVQVSRAENTDDLIYDLYVLVFDSEKKLKTILYDDFLNDLKNQRTITLNTTSGVSYIFAVANIHQGNPAEYNVEDVAAKLNSLWTSNAESPFTLDEFKQMEIKLAGTNVDIINRTQGRYVMSGKFKPTSGTDQGDGQVDIPETNARLNGEIPLYRTDARITFNLYTEGTKGTFTPTTFRVMNVPLRSRLSNETEDIDGITATSGKEQDYYSIPAGEALNITKEVVDETLGAYRTFTFYLAENRKAAKNTSLSGYHEREKQQKEPVTGETDRVTNGDWVNAPDYGTYVILSGRFIGTDDNNQQIDANVQYKIHLGNFSNRNWSNFSTVRNTDYTYNVRVNGVNSIIVEVRNNTEGESGATGDVYYTSTTNLYTLDAHYETCLMEFDYRSLADYQQKGQINYRVHTPFTDLGADKSADADWVRFKINSKSGWGTNVTYSSDLEDYSTGQGDLLTIEEFIQLLQTMATDQDHENWDRNEQFKVTCFVHEYYYTNDETESGYVAQSRVPKSTNINASVPAWKYAVNQPNRTLQILCNVQSSADGESSIIDAAYVLSQRSIQTFYNADIAVTGLTSALGLETLNETHNLPMGHPSEYPRSNTDGLTNTLDMWGNAVRRGRWSTYIDYAANGYTAPQKNASGNTDTHDYLGLKSRYQFAYIACMQRNRDDNGNGMIDGEEVKWYMPALNQYAAFFIGAGALSQESRFYKYPNWRLKHYHSSTYDDKSDGEMDDGDVMMVWAEEGFSTSTLNQAVGWGASNDKTERSYRCVRNLGNISTNGAGGKRPQNYWYQDASNKNIIRFNYLDPSALRQIPVTRGELSGNHTDRSMESRVYSAFAIAQYDTESLSSAGEARDAMTLCSSYNEEGGGTSGRWRVPNLRELLFMALNGKQGSNVITSFPYSTNRGYHCRTLFNWSSALGYTEESPLDGQKRYGFFLVPSTGNVSLNNSSSEGSGYYLRCVRDISEE